MTVRKISAVDVANRSVVNPGKAQVYDVRQVSQQLVSTREVIFGSGTGIPEASIKIVNGTPTETRTFYAEQYDIDAGGQFFVIGRKYKVFKFNTSGTIQANSASARFFVSGAGGGGGADSGGGGGAGELIALTGDINQNVSWTIGAGTRDSKQSALWHKANAGGSTSLTSQGSFRANTVAPFTNQNQEMTNIYAFAMGGNPGWTLRLDPDYVPTTEFYFTQTQYGDRYQGCGGGGAATTSSTDQKGMSPALGEPAREPPNQQRVDSPVVSDWYRASGSSGGNSTYGVVSMSSPPTGWRSSGGGGGCGIFDFYPTTGGTWGPKSGLVNQKHGKDAIWSPLTFDFFFSKNLVNNQSWNFSDYINAESGGGDGGMGCLPAQFNYPDMKTNFDNAVGGVLNYPGLNRGGVGFNGYGRNSLDTTTNLLPYSSGGNTTALQVYDANGAAIQSKYISISGGGGLGGYYAFGSGGSTLTFQPSGTYLTGILDGKAGTGSGGAGTGAVIYGNISISSRGGSGYVIICVEIK